MRSSGSVARMGAISEKGPVVRFGAFTLDAATRRLLRGTVDVHLTRKAFDLLSLLVLDAPRVLTKAELYDRLWPGTFVAEATLVGLIKELRRALDDRDRTARIIRTVHGVGYAFAATVERVREDASNAPCHWVEVDGRHIRLREGENVIGRDPSSRVWLDVATISRRHARILVGENGAVLEDLGSKNRTKLGDAAVDGQARLQDGDRILVGAILLVYRASLTGMGTETQPS
jgi:DNA-binding winged helix-turn-helix (wHTH) protein